MAVAKSKPTRKKPPTSRGKYIRSEDEFIRKALDLKRRPLAGVRRALKAGDTERAWQTLFSHFARRKRPCDPLLADWPNTNKAAVRRAVVSAGENLAAWRVAGRIDWDHGNQPPREDWEKYWGRGRLAHLSSWAAAAEASGRADLRKAVAGSFLEWYQDRPVPDLPHLKCWHQQTHGFSWREIEVAIRGRMFIRLFLAAVRWPDAPGEFLRKLLISILQHLDYLRTYYDTFGFIKGNHQNHHAEAPLAAGVLLPELKSATRFKRLGLRIYREHLKADFDSDAVQNEYSPAYHANMLVIYLDAYEVMKTNREAPPSWLSKAVRKMAEYLLYSTAPDGWLLPINDSGPHLSEPLRRRAAKVLGMPQLLTLEKRKPARSGPKPSRAFMPAGLALMRSGWDAQATYVVLDATKHNSGHWHAGKPNLLIQSGKQQLACEHLFGNYDDPSFWQYFHNARAHNTVLVDGQGDGVPESPWRYEHISNPELNFFASGRTADIARATTDGFRRLKPRVEFERTIVFVKPDLILVHDVLESRGEHCYEWLLHFLPGQLQSQSRARSLVTALGGGTELLCRPVGGDDSELIGPLIRAGKTRNRTSGVSNAGRDYWTPPKTGSAPELLVDAPYAVWSRVGKRVAFDFVLQVLKAKDAPVPIEVLETGSHSGCTAYSLRSKRRRATVLFDDRKGIGRTPLIAGGLELSGRVGVAVTGGGRRADLLSDGKLTRKDRRRKTHR
jgi:Heparinase II/III N-terminus/Heparinase II/III-like protein